MRKCRTCKKDKHDMAYSAFNRDDCRLCEHDIKIKKEQDERINQFLKRKDRQSQLEQDQIS